MRTFTGFAKIVGFLSLVALAATGCSGIAVGTGAPGDAEKGDASAVPSDQPSEQEIVSGDAGTSATDASSSADAGSPKTASATATLIVDGQSAPVGLMYARAQSAGHIASSISFTTPIFHADLLLDVRLVGSGCSPESGNSLAMVNTSATANNLFLPEQPDSVCGLVITSAGTRVVGSFQGNVINSTTSVKHSIGLSFDIPVE